MGSLSSRRKLNLDAESNENTLAQQEKAVGGATNGNFGVSLPYLGDNLQSINLSVKCCFLYFHQQDNALNDYDPQ
jgi:hypothetical protein